MVEQPLSHKLRTATRARISILFKMNSLFIDWLIAEKHCIFDLLYLEASVCQGVSTPQACCCKQSCDCLLRLVEEKFESLLKNQGVARNSTGVLIGRPKATFNRIEKGRRATPHDTKFVPHLYGNFIQSYITLLKFRALWKLFLSDNVRKVVNKRVNRDKKVENGY